MHFDVLVGYLGYGEVYLEDKGVVKNFKNYLLQFHPMPAIDDVVNGIHCPIYVSNLCSL